MQNSNTHLKLYQADNRFILFHKGQQVLDATENEMRDILGDLVGKKGDELEKALDGHAAKLMGTAKYWNNFTFDMLMEPPPKLPCFAAGTLVSCQSGLKPIEQIEVGETVLSQNPNTQKPEWKTVSQTFVNHAEKMVKLHCAGTTLLATGQHLFWAQNQAKWVPASQLSQQDHLVNANGQAVAIAQLEIVELSAPTYNLQIEDHQNYYVGQAQVLTHNASKNSRFADATIREVEFYQLFEKPTDPFYVGQTIQGSFPRAEQHKYEGRTTKKPSKQWKKNIRGVFTFKGPIKVTAYEAAVIELYEIMNLKAQGGVVHNAQKPIGKKKFNKFKKTGGNPCRFYK